jgi:hypothetical protein
VGGAVRILIGKIDRCVTNGLMLHVINNRLITRLWSSPLAGND